MSTTSGRNDPCPCGSGKKLKKCCGGQVASSAGPRAGSIEAKRLLLAFERATKHHAAGEDAEAKNAYLEVLRADPKNAAALGNLASVETRLGNMDAAKLLLTQAVAVSPLDAQVHLELAKTLFLLGDIAGARRHYEIALRLDPKNLDAHRGIAFALLRLGEREAAIRFGRIGHRGAEAHPYRGKGEAPSILVLKSALNNIPLERVLDERYFRIFELIVEFFDPEIPLPPHDVALNCVGDVELDGGTEAFAAVEQVLALTQARVINPPARIRATGRVETARRLRAIPGVVTSETAALPRDLLLSPDAASALGERGFTWPLLVRSPGFHTGDHFVKVDDPAALREAMSALPGDELLVMQFLDTRGADGMFRKYRVMFIDGKLYPLHLAVSPRWKVHYFSADMADSVEHRAEDAAFLNDMAGVLGSQAVEALERINEAIGLSYGGIDFALDASGRVVVFEANASMLIAPVAHDPRWDYRGPAVQRAMAAARALLSPPALRK